MLKLIFLLILMIVATECLAAQKYFVHHQSNNTVKFISDAKMETVVGTTDKIDGYLEVSNSESFIGTKIYIEVEPHSLDTGLELRNKHLREDYLRTNKYPAIYFEGLITTEKLARKDTTNVVSEGSFFLNGKKKVMKINGQLIKTNSKINIISKFKINLNDFNIKIPTIMFMKINEEIEIELNLHLK